MMPDQRPATPDIDTLRVQTLRARIEEEIYIVNSQQIADKMIDLENALFRLQQRPS